jgi:glycerol-3-phosphate dehydrogenase
VSGGTVLGAGGSYWYLNSGPAYPSSTLEKRRPPPPWTPPSREHMLNALKASGAIKPGDLGDDIFDLLIVGGGATGAGIAVDAATRGLKVALVERDDFSAGESLQQGDRPDRAPAYDLQASLFPARLDINLRTSHHVLSLMRSPL